MDNPFPRCATCTYWVRPSERVNNIYEDDGEWENESVDQEVHRTGRSVRACDHPKMVRFMRPEPGAASLLDGSEYRADLFTDQDFGCTLHIDLSPSRR